LHTEVHISEILDSDNDSVRAESSEEERPARNIWSKAEFWDSGNRNNIVVPLEQRNTKPKTVSQKSDILG